MSARRCLRAAAVDAHLSVLEDELTVGQIAADFASGTIAGTADQA